MVKAVRKAGRRLVRDFGEIANLQVSRKGPGDFVSNADTMVERVLIEQLSTDRPDYGFITEETGTIPARNNSPYTWVIDPIDGTTNFIHAIPFFAISVALMHQDTVIAGVVYNPITNDLYYAEKGKGCYLMTPTGNSRLRVSARSNIETALIGSNYFKGEANRTNVVKFAESAASIRYNGSTTLSLAAVAAGQYDGYIATQFKLWDVAAGYLLVKEAGGFMSDYVGNRELSDIMKEQTIIASNAALKDVFLAYAKK
ncbi:MAG: inositol monophosphatase [Alphaproteobacteria bacterium]|nr:inositol monophosphatase [Alphaproteobacteria bacterium]